MKVPYRLRHSLWALVALLAGGCADANRNGPDSWEFDPSLAQSEQAVESGPGQVVLTAVQDTSVSEDDPNTNYGSASVLRVNRALVQFGQADLVAAIGTGDALTSAKLELRLVNTRDTERDPRTRWISANRLTKSWTELGATWNCAADTRTSNRKENCSKENEWSMDAASWFWRDNPWDDPPTANVTVKRGETGTVQFDVTSDVRKFVSGAKPNYGWILGSEQGGTTDFASRETSAPPRLVLSIRHCDPSMCDDGNPCTTDGCSAGACVHAAAPNGTACDDGNACSQVDSCQAGVCTGASPVACSPLDACHVAGTCDAKTGVCSNPVASDGTACDDGNACTQADTCVAGACTGANPVGCAALDACHVAGACDPASGACSNPPAPDGTACNDGNACTQIDSCQAGTCTGASPIACAPLDACHAAGACDPASGACSNPPVPDGTACSDGNACTRDDQCVDGACTSGAAVACASTDGCHPGVCDPGTGACSNPLSCHLYGVGTLSGSLHDGLVSPIKLHDGTPDDQVGALGSAISYTGQGNLYVATPDRGPSAGDDAFTDRFYLIDLSLSGGVVTPSIKGAAALTKGSGLGTFTGLATAFDATNSPDSLRLDPEGVRVSPRGTFFVSDEYGPFLYEFSADGTRQRALSVPDKFLVDHPGVEDAELPPANTKGRQSNRGMEGLAISPDGSKLYGIMQSPLIQDGALDGSNKRIGKNIRILEVDVTSGGTREFLYQLSDKSNGVNEILAVNDHQFLVDERDGNGGTSAQFKKLFLLDLSGATDISAIASLPSTGTPAGVVPGQKTPFLDLLDDAYGLAGAAFPEKIEGLAFGPDLPDGRHVLVVTSDNDFLPGQDTKMFVFTIDPPALPGFVAQSASFPTGCADAPPCTAADACHLAGVCNPGTTSCSTPAALVGTPVGEQTPGDCHRVQCDGAGSVVSAVDDADVPVDGNTCTSDSCNAGSPSNVPVASGTACSQGGTMCNGAGACVQCLSAVDCPASGTECMLTTCVSGACGFAPATAGTPVSGQVAGDCLVNQCDDSGNIVAAVDDTDLPMDGNACTADLCAQGVFSNPPLAAGTSCGGANECDGNGVCVGCITATDCPGHDTECGQRTCVAGACGMVFAAAGTVTATQQPGDCRVSQCDGAGGVTLVVDNTDVFVDGKQCTSDVCTSGVSSNPNLPAGTSCSENGGTVCDGSGACGSPTVRVVRVGDGSAALSNASTAVFIDERKLDGTLVGTTPLPTAAAGSNQPFALSGSASSEGGLSLSGDGRYLVMAGYAAAPGLSGVASTTAAAVKRGVARIDASGAVDTSTLLSTAFNANNVRGATSSDGSGFWVGGAGGATGGVWFVPLGANGGTQVVSTPNNVRWFHVIGGQLYGSSNTNPNSNVFLVGTGLPTSLTTVTSLPGMPTTGSGNNAPSPFSFVLLDRDPNVPGLDTAYVADDRNAPLGGVQKWTFNGSTWTLAATFNVSIAPIGFRGLAGFVTGGSVTLVGTTADGSANRVVVVVDDGTPAGKSTVIATAASNTIFRGLALSPHP